MIIPPPRPTGPRSVIPRKRYSSWGIRLDSTSHCVLARENSLAARHLSNGTLVLYDVSSAAFEGHTCPLGKIGHARDGSKAGCRASTGCCAQRQGCRSPSRCSTATPLTRKPLPPRSTSSKPGSGCPTSPWWAIGACSPARASVTSCVRRSWIGSARCAPTRSGSWSTTRRCSCRYSMSRTCSRSPTRTTPASGWCAATPRPGRRTRAQTRRAAGGHRKRTADHRRGHPPPETTLTWVRQDRAAGGHGAQQLQDGQTL